MIHGTSSFVVGLHIPIIAIKWPCIWARDDDSMNSDSDSAIITVSDSSQHWGTGTVGRTAHGPCGPGSALAARWQRGRARGRRRASRRVSPFAVRHLTRWVTRAFLNLIRLSTEVRDAKGCVMFPMLGLLHRPRPCP